ncbi:MAG: hypothetical protein H3C51_04000 [Rubellimicrobium sp.]|nr:hypothetical protein [Rubellimicrobium sp.]
MGRQTRLGLLWVLVVLVVTLAGIVVPYGFLSGSGAPLAVPLFWSGFGLVVIALIAVAVARWRV